VDQQEQRVASAKRRSRAEAAQLAAESEASGLSRIEFCRKQGLGLATLNRYLKWRREARAETTGVNLIAVELRGARAAATKRLESGLAVALAGGRRIEIARGFDAPTLVQLLGLLERC
jgi:hypothetical protein